VLAVTELTPTNASLLRALRRRGVHASPCAPAELRVRAPSAAPRLVLGRLVLDDAGGVTPGWCALKRLERTGVTVVNPAEALLACHDKLATALLLARAHLPHPRTAFVDGAADVSRLAPPFVVRRRFGERDGRMPILPDAAALTRYLRGLERQRWFRQQGALVQERACDGEGELRLVVAGGDVVGGAARDGSAGEWQRLRTVPAQARELATAAAAAAGAGLVGVDLMLRPGGYALVELDAAVELTSVYSLAGDDVFDRIARWLALVVSGAHDRARKAPEVALRVG
jgi:glutathione synthase/RimK-type ligase-like ATP-grasp enzyme